MSNLSAPTHGVKVVILLYYRCSTEKQDTSIETQQKTCLPEFTRIYGHITEEYIDEGKSGSHDTEEREAWLRMLHDATEGKYKGQKAVIGVLDLDRFGRLDSVEVGQYVDPLKKAGVKIHSLRQGVIDLNTSTGRILFSVFCETNNDFSVKIAYRGLQGRINALIAGKTDGQVTPYAAAKLVTPPQGEPLTIKRGDKFSKPKDWNSTFIPGDEEEVKALLWIFQTYASEDIPVRQMAAKAENLGLPSPTGQGWQRQSIFKILRNPIYCGTGRIGVEPQGEFFRAQGNTATATQDHAHEPLLVPDAYPAMKLIDADTWKKVQTKLATFKKTGRKTRGPGYPLSGILHCGHCGRRLVACNSRGIIAYRCPAYGQNPNRSCGGFLVYQDEVLPFILDELVKELGVKIIEAMNVKPSIQSGDEQMEKLRKELEKKNKELDRMRKNLALADEDVFKELQSAFKAVMIERDAVAQEIESRKMSATPKDFVRKMLEWWDEIKDQLVPVRTGEIVHVNGRQHHLGAFVETPVLRERLHQLNTRLDVFMTKVGESRTKGKRAWEIDKARLQGEINGKLLSCDNESRDS